MRRAGRILTVCLGLAAGAVSLSSACRTPTQVTLEIESLATCSDLKGTSIFVAGGADEAEARAERRFETTSTAACEPRTTGGPGARIGTLVVTPGNDVAAVIVVAGFGARAETCAPPEYRGCIVARRRFAFIRQSSVRLPIVLDPDCVDVPCGATSTCVDKRCVDSEVRCEERGTCTEPGRAPDGGLIEVDARAPRDGAPRDDGSARDASRDAAPDASRDGGRSGTCGVVSCASSTGPDGACEVLEGQAFCCYAPPSETQCTEERADCAGTKGCCRSAADCPDDLYCCANAQSPGFGVVLQCASEEECVRNGGGGTYVCRAGPEGQKAECPPSKSYCSSEPFLSPLMLCTTSP